MMEVLEVLSDCKMDGYWLASIFSARGGVGIPPLPCFCLRASLKAEYVYNIYIFFLTISKLPEA